MIWIPRSICITAVGTRVAKELGCKNIAITKNAIIEALSTFIVIDLFFI